ncbi:hypothetical protein J132_01341 [Termitomyces sp. J132]|nr:hypothetical protein J132_01341 [Termitomyces sp. J132]
MSTTNLGGSNPPIFPDDCQFDGTNYTLFRDRVVIAVQLKGADGYLGGSILAPHSETKPSPTASPATATEWWDPSPSPQQWRAQNARALALIVYNTENPVGVGIQMSGMAVEAWSTLRKSYGAVSDLGVASMENVLRMAKYKDSADFPEHIADL